MDPKFEFAAEQFIDFNQPDPYSDEWFDLNHENELTLNFENAESDLPKGENRRLTKELNDNIVNKENKLPVSRRIFETKSAKKNVEVNQSKRRQFYLKTNKSACRQNEIKRRSLTKLAFNIKGQQYASNNSISSKASHGSVSGDHDDKETNFIESLRQYDSPDPNKKYVKRSTVPVPFSFCDGSSNKSKPMVEEFRSLAQQVIAYQMKTPLRFRMKPRSASVEPKIPESTLGSFQRSYSLRKHYVPQSPFLLTKDRKRNLNVESQEAIENRQYEQMKNYQFRANPFKESIFQKNYNNLPMKYVKHKTVFKPFSFHINAPVKATRMSFNEEASKFQARPVPKDLFKRPLGIPKVPKREHVRVQPFSFEEFDRERLKHKEEKISKVFEEEKRLREFRANPLPDLQVKGIPEKQPKPKTVVKPFDFLANERDLNVLGRKRLAEEIKRLYDPHPFKAKSPVSIIKPPFVPQKPNRFLTTIDAPNLHTETRAVKRELFNQALKEKEERRIAQEERMKMEDVAVELEEVSRIRSSAVHKAQPIRKYRNLEKPPTREVTIPTTPRCLERRSFKNDRLDNTILSDIEFEL